MVDFSLILFYPENMFKLSQKGNPTFNSVQLTNAMNTVL